MINIYTDENGRRFYHIQADGWKTITFNITMLVVGIISYLWPEFSGPTTEQVKVWFDQDSGLVMILLSIANTILRFWTVRPVGSGPKPEPVRPRPAQHKPWHTMDDPIPPHNERVPVAIDPAITSGPAIGAAIGAAISGNTIPAIYPEQDPLVSEIRSALNEIRDDPVPTEHRAMEEKNKA